MENTGKWLLIRDVEYSTDFSFFTKNQLFVSKSGANYTFNSRLEKFNFFTQLVLEPLSEETIKEISYKIFDDLHNGKYGQGVYVD
jgi:hypothetical protein